MKWAFISLNLLIFLTYSSPIITCSNDRSFCNIQFVFENEPYQFEVFQEKHKLFQNDVQVVINGETILDVTKKDEDIIRYSNKEDQTKWVTCSISKNNELIEGLFSTEKNGIVEFGQQGDSKLRGRKLAKKKKASVKINDVFYDAPGGKPWLKTTPSPSGTPPLTAMFSSVTGSGIIPFFPSCYPQDLVPHIFKMDIVIDYGVYLRLTNGATGSEADKWTKLIKPDLEAKFAVGKLFYLLQLNVRVEIRQVKIGGPNDPVPLSRSQGNCAQALLAFDEMQKWNNINNPKDPTGYSLLVSDCFQSITGVSYVGTITGSVNNAGVALYDPLIIFHELGHGFGCTHSFENKIGLTGGIMDYGDGKYNGVIQFHPNKRDELCPFLSYVKNSNSPFFYAADVTATCGDGILSKTEQCECLDGSTSCLNCNKCVPSPNAECSTDTFVLRNSAMEDVVVVEASQLDSAECCVNNRYSSPKTLCGDGLNVCSKGKCVDVCSNLLGFGTTNCGFDSTGCVLGCRYQGTCTWSLRYMQDGVKYLVGAVPDGTKCPIGKTGFGTCSTVQGEATCVSSTGSEGTQAPFTANPTNKPTSIPTNKPTTRSPTLLPTTKPSRSPTALPTTPPTQQPGTLRPTLLPTSSPTRLPTQYPTTLAPTLPPTLPPTKEPTNQPTRRPSQSPTSYPTRKPSSSPTPADTNVPSESPTPMPTPRPIFRFTRKPSSSPTPADTNAPSESPTPMPTPRPIFRFTRVPTVNVFAYTRHPTLNFG